MIPRGLDATLVLVRHGESEWIAQGRFQGQSETPLSETGRQQAALVGRRLAWAHASPALPIPSGPPREIAHSPLARTRETASAIASAIEAAADGSQVTLRPEPGILELAQGEWEGVTQEEIARRWPVELSAWRHRPWEAWAPGGESLAEVQQRVRPALGGILEHLGRDYPRGTIDRSQVGGYHGAGPARDQPWSILVGHDGVFKIVMLTLFDLPLERFWMFSFPLCGITVVDLRGGRPVLRAHGLVEHLAPLLDEDAAEIARRRAASGAL